MPAMMRMIIICLMLICKTTLLPSQNVLDNYADVKSFQCSFVEVKMMKSLDESFISEGAIKYSQTEIIFEYTKPEHIVIRKDADDNITVTKNDRNVKTNAFHKQTLSFIESLFSGNIDDFADSYQITTTTDDEQNIVELISKKKSRVESMELYLDKSDDAIINKIIVKEAKGNVVTITLSDTKIIM